MAFTPADSAIRLTPEQEKHVNTLTSTAEITAYMVALAAQQNLITFDALSGDPIPTALADNAPRQFGKVVRINGVAHSLVADSPEALLRAESDLLARLMSESAESAPRTEQPRSPDGRFVEQGKTDEAAKRSELEASYRLGQISLSDFIEQSGLVDEVLAKRGIEPTEITEKRFEKSWAQATESFLHSPAGADWPGGEELKTRVAEMIAAAGLQDSPSAETLAYVYELIKQEDRVKNSSTFEELKAAVGYTGVRSASGIWGR